MKKPTYLSGCRPDRGFTFLWLTFIHAIFLYSSIAAQECVIIIQGYEEKDDYFASNGADALEEAFKNFPGGAKVTKLRPSGSNKSKKPGTDYSSKADLLKKLEEALCDEKCKDVLLAFVGHGMGGPGGIHSAPSANTDGGMWVGEEGAPPASTFIEAAEIAALIDKCKKEVKLLDSHCYAGAMANGIANALKNKDLLKVALASSAWNEESKFHWPDKQIGKGFYDFLIEFLIDYYKIIGDPNVMEEIRKKADELKKKAEQDNKQKETEREKLRKEIAAKEKELAEANAAKDKLEKELKDLNADKDKTQQKIDDLQQLSDLIDEYQKLEQGEKDWSSEKEKAKIKEIEKKYTDQWKALPKNQQTAAKKKELEKSAKEEADAVKKEYKEKREEYKKKKEENGTKRKDLAKKLKDQGVNVDPSATGANKNKIKSELDKQEKSKKELEDKIKKKEDELKAQNDKIKALEDEIKALKDKLAGITDLSTEAPVMELILHYAFISAKANTKSSSPEEPQKPISDNEKVELPDKKMKTIGIDEFKEGGVIKYKKYLNFYKVIDKKTGKCVVVGYLESELNRGWPEQPLISKDCKEDCSMLEVVIKDGDKEIKIKLVKQKDGKYKAEVDGKEEESHEYAFHVPFNPPGGKSEYLALVTNTFSGNDAPPAYFIDGDSLEGTYDDATSTGQFVYQGNRFDIAFLDHGAVQFRGMGRTWTQQNARQYSLYDKAGNRIGEAGFVIDGENATGTLWIEDGEQLHPLSGSYSSYTNQFQLKTHGILPEYSIEKNDTYGREETTWHKTGMTGSSAMLPKLIPVPFIELLDSMLNVSSQQAYPSMTWNTFDERLPSDVNESYIGTRIRKKNQATGDVSYFDFKPGVDHWEDHDVEYNTDYTYCISSATNDNYICSHDVAENPPFYSYPACFDWSHNKKDSTEEISENHFPWIPVIGIVVTGGIVTYVITRPDNPSGECDWLASAQSSPATCQLSNGNISTTVSPSGQYEYLWSNGSTESALQNIPPGNYTVTISQTGTDCNRIVQATVSNQNPSFDASFITADAHCGSQEGSIQANVSPAGAYTYIWSTGATTSAINNLSPGIYMVTISAGGSCTKTYSTTITEIPVDFTILSTSTSSACGLSNGTINLDVSPAGAYSYLWSNGSTSSQISGLSPGQYNVTVSITGTTCSKNTTITVDELPPSFEIIATSTPSGCGFSDGAADIIINPVGEYIYAWSNGSTTSSASGLVAGDYNVTVTIFGTQCSKTTTITIEELPASFTLSFINTPTPCGQSGGVSVVNVTPPGNYEYAWSNGSTESQATNLSAGIHMLTVTLAGTSCSVDTSIQIHELPSNFHLLINTTYSGCGQSNGTGFVIASPPANYIYAWSNGGTQAQLTGLAPGVYQVTVTLAGTTCSQDTSLTIPELPPAFTISSSTTPSGCSEPTGSATIVVDPSGEYTYVWSNGMTGPNVTGIAAGEYTVTVTITGTTCNQTSVITVGQSGVNFTGTIATEGASCGFGDGSAVITMDPPGEYTYLWSNQQAGSAATQLMSGEYSVIVTDINGCSTSFSTTVGEEPAEYISIISTTPGTCIGNGDIQFSLITPGSGPILLDVVGPAGSIPVSLAQGTYFLTSFANVLPGNYTFTVHDQSIGTTCSEIVQVSVVDNTPALITMDDFYMTPGGISVIENALENDSGLNIQMTSISNIVGGDVNFTNDGSFSFFPDQGFSGNASFTYVVTDGCGTSSTGIVTIFVEEVECIFSIDATTTPASCGLSDGTIFVEVIEPGNYSYFWDTGDTGPALEDVSAGSYTITIVDDNLGCELEFTISVSENPADYISNVVITQPTCTMQGEIQFTASTSSQNQLIMSIQHPGGSNVFIIDPGIILLSDFIEITPGSYMIEISDEGAGSDCFDSFTANLVNTTSVQITVQNVQPPSSPSAMDGIIFITATIQGVLPYTIFLNGTPHGTANQHSFAINGLGAGNYTVQVRGANGCFSNILQVNVPNSGGFNLSLGNIAIYSPYDVQTPEHGSGSTSGKWRYGILAALEYKIDKHPQEMQITYSAPEFHGRQNINEGYIEIQHLSEMEHLDWNQIKFSFDAGVGIRTGIPLFNRNFSTKAPQFWSLNVSAAYDLKHVLKFESRISLRGWDSIEKPLVDFSVKLPMGR